MVLMMGGGSSSTELAVDPNRTTTLLLVGRTGNGKSATGNSILGRKAFESKASASGVTITTQLQTAAPAFLGGRHTITVIDTPGLCGVGEDSQSVVREIVRCAELARDGIHAIVVVLTTRSRFSVEELVSLRSLQALFGEKMVDYMILLFTGGDDLEADDESLQDYVGEGCPHALKELVGMCHNRYISFNNRTKDDIKMQNQVKELLYLVHHEVISKNDGKSYKGKLFDELKRNSITLSDNPEFATYLSSRQKSSLEKKLAESYEQQLKSITKTIEVKMVEVTVKFEKQLEAERKARAELQGASMLAAKKSMEDIAKLRKDLGQAQNEAKDLRNRGKGKWCAIL